MLLQSHGIWDLTSIFQLHKPLLSWANSTVIVHACNVAMYVGLFKPSRCQVLGHQRWSERIGSSYKILRFKRLLEYCSSHTCIISTHLLVIQLWFQHAIGPYIDPSLADISSWRLNGLRGYRVPRKPWDQRFYHSLACYFYHNLLISQVRSIVMVHACKRTMLFCLLETNGSKNHVKVLDWTKTIYRAYETIGFKTILPW